MDGASMHGAWSRSWRRRTSWLAMAQAGLEVALGMDRYSASRSSGRARQQRTGTCGSCACAGSSTRQGHRP